MIHRKCTVDVVDGRQKKVLLVWLRLANWEAREGIVLSSEIGDVDANVAYAWMNSGGVSFVVREN